MEKTTSEKVVIAAPMSFVDATLWHASAILETVGRDDIAERLLIIIDKLTGDHEDR